MAATPTASSVDERFVLKVPSNLDLAGAAPLLCAGITTYSPMRHWGVAKGRKVGVAGLGGLGHMGVKFAHAFGAHVVVFTTSPGKKEDALRLGADEVVVSRNAGEMQKHAGSFDFILDAVSPITTSMPTSSSCAATATSPWSAHPQAPGRLGIRPHHGRRSLSGSNIGGIPETQEMLDFCGAHRHRRRGRSHSHPEGQRAYQRLLKSDVKYRFSIDMHLLRPSKATQRRMGNPGGFARWLGRNRYHRLQTARALRPRLRFVAKTLFSATKPKAVRKSDWVARNSAFQKGPLSRSPSGAHLELRAPSLHAERQTASSSAE